MSTMRYVLSNLTDGQPPEWRAIAGEPAEGEVLVSEPPAEGLVWDAASEALREKTDAERLAERRDEQAQKIRDEAGRRLVEATRATTLEEAIAASVTELSEAYEAGAPLPQHLKDRAAIKNEMESLLYQVYTSAEPEVVWFA